ncbi:MAG: penicillin acylase family protein, partial [Candidatus Heimdallarchaeota archaeon]|nr:penicillin acylase family protein [Candidatus Heimdallarchaeota archaeon]
MSLISTILGPPLKIFIKRSSKKKLPRIDGELKLPGIHGPIEIVRDTTGVPHISAGDDIDMYFAQGFVHAQDRLWQMELNRLTANGKLSEVFGKIALDTDKITRTLGFYRLAKKDWEDAPEQVKKVITAYKNGINTFINSPDTNIPVEFTLVKHKPVLWTEIDIYAFGRMLTWMMSFGWSYELTYSKLIDAVGAEYAAELEINYSPENPIQVPKIEFNIRGKDGSLKSGPGPFIAQGGGSNSWVISSEKSVTGKPILANDTHLHMTSPNIFYQNHIRSKDQNVTGVSIPGVPFVLIGHNDRIGWGFTFSYSDVADLFIEKINDKNQYLFKEKWKDMEVIHEMIRIKGELDHLEKVMVTHHGPILPDMLTGTNDKLAFSSMQLKTPASIIAFYNINNAKSWDEFVEAMKNFHSPSLNATYGDVDGNIGYWCTGKVPKRIKGDGSFPVPGWTGEYEWKGEIPFEKMPHLFNPKSGYFVTCNNKIVDDKYPHFMSKISMNGYRAKRLQQLIESKDKISIEDCISMQLDVMCLPGLELQNIYKELDLKSSDPVINHALDLFLNWDGYLYPDTCGGTVYEVTRYQLIKNLFEPNLGKEITEQYLGIGPDPLLFPTNEYYGNDTVVLLRLLNKENSWWLKKAGGRDELLRISFQKAVLWLRKKLGSNPDKWQWGKIHTIEFP